MTKLFEYSAFFIFAFILLTDEVAETMNVISKFNFDISDERITDKDRQKISDALGRLAFASFELKIQLNLLKEFQHVIMPKLNSVYSDKKLNKVTFKKKIFIKDASWALIKEIKYIINLAEGPGPNRKRRYEELEEGPRKYFIQNGNYPLPNDGLIKLKRWAKEEHLLDEYDNFIINVEDGIYDFGSIFSHEKLAPVMNELKNIMDAPAIAVEATVLPNGDINMEIEQPIQNNEQHQQQNIHPPAGPSADQKHYFEEKGREELKKLLVLALNKKDNYRQQKGYYGFDAEDEFGYMDRQVMAIPWTRIRYEVFFMHLNLIWLLLGGIEKYVNYQPEFMEKTKPPIKIFQMENEYTKDYTKRIEQMKILTNQSLEMIKLFAANLKKSNGEEKNGYNPNLREAIGRKFDENGNDGNQLLFEIIRDHPFISKLNHTKNRKIWMELDAAKLEAFADYTGKKFDRRHLGMVLQRQLLTEIGALKIVLNYIIKRGKHYQKMEAKKEAFHSAVEPKKEASNSGALHQHSHFSEEGKEDAINFWDFYEYLF